jgi:phosphate ABC transporter phosphate-binding protein
MNSTFKLGISILAIAIILGSALGIMFFSQPNSTPNPSSNISPTMSPNPTTTSLSSGTNVNLNGAGASFPYPLLDGIISIYRTIAPSVQINYQPSGSGAGVTSLKDKLVDFAASDAPLSASEVANIPSTVHIPETIGAVVVTYNFGSETPNGLKLTGPVIADIYQGKITKWNDPVIADLNPDIVLPNQAITVVHRSDGSGTTYIFTSYLSEVSNDWSSEVGSGKDIAWPTGLGSPGNAGVAGIVKSTPYSIGYVELAYALETSMNVAKIKNPAGNFVLPTTISTEYAAQAAASQGLPSGSDIWSNVSLLNTDGEDAYPIVSFSYIIAFKELNVVPGMTQEKATALLEFLWYVIHDGQEIAPDLSYAQLPENVIQINEATLKSITYNGHTLING